MSLSDADYAQRMAGRRQASANRARIKAAEIEAGAIKELAAALARLESKIDRLLDAEPAPSTQPIQDPG